jgi:2-hydroxy-3-keto-5-methylthiopentenyl-1-phosphate phosphatase
MTILKNKQNKIQIAKVISKNLLFRDSVNELFDNINNSEAPEIIIDFRSVQSITRSFAHQYLINKEKSKKTIINVNIPPTIKTMFEIIQKTKQDLICIGKEGKNLSKLISIKGAFTNIAKSSWDELEEAGDKFVKEELR